MNFWGTVQVVVPKKSPKRGPTASHGFSRKKMDDGEKDDIEVLVATNRRQEREIKYLKDEIEGKAHDLK